MPPYKQTNDTDWIGKEKRELFAKAVNSMLMTTPLKSLVDALNDARTIVDSAFEYYPDKVVKTKGEEVDLEFGEKIIEQ